MITVTRLSRAAEKLGRRGGGKVCPTFSGCYHSHIAPSVPLTSAIRPEVKVESPDNRRHPFSTSSGVTRFDVAKLRSSSVDLDERDWCCDLGEFVNA